MARNHPALDLLLLLCIVVTPVLSYRGVDIARSDFHVEISKQLVQPKSFKGQLIALRDLDQGTNSTDGLFSEMLRSQARAQAFFRIVGRAAGDLQDNDYKSPMASVPGGFAMKVTFGTPEKTFMVIADTGSDLVWVQCKPCRGCFSQPDPMFDPAGSSTYKTLTCKSPYCKALPKTGCNSSTTCSYTYQYGDQSKTLGNLATETITLTTSSGEKYAVKNFAFGCGFQNSGSFQQIDGLLGLGKGLVSFTSQLAKVIDNKFSYCLNTFGLWFIPRPAAPILFGESAVPAGEVQYTPFVENKAHPSFYYVDLQSITVDNKKLDIPSTAFAIDSKGQGGILFDSGTTITYLVDAAYQPLEAALKAAIKYPEAQSPQPNVFNLCYDVRNEITPQYPTVVFNFQGADYQLDAVNLFISVDLFGTVQCLGITTSNFPLSIIGNVQQGNFHIVYDRENSRLGFVNTDCTALA